MTLCKDMASGLLNAPSTPVWREARAEPRRLDRLAIHLSFEAADPADGRVKPMHATCFYRYDAVEETAMTLADPLSAFSTSPSGMTLNGREVANPLLAEAVKEVMLKQGREFLERARRGIEEAADQARERLNGLQSSD
ncbi:hypothetical protein [Thiocystis violacea]|uniref:hypothetical protein n=1 Tax=Thiocystis violacea TaxID=13725 RepID=UPI001F5B4B1F|nr:hypothetical protein [Thiocystis violacea]